MTCLQLLELMLAAFVACECLMLGWRHAGLGWGIAAGIVGWIVGLRVARIPFMMWLKSSARELGAKTTDELRASLLDGTAPAPQLVCLEIRSRGEDTPEVLAYIIGMLESDDETIRRRGWAALTSAWPELARQIKGYRPTAPASDCRSWAARLHEQSGD